MCRLMCLLKMLLVIMLQAFSLYHTGTDPGFGKGKRVHQGRRYMGLDSHPPRYFVYFTLLEILSMKIQ